MQTPKIYLLPLMEKPFVQQLIMDSYESPLHIVTAQISKFGLSFAQKTVEGKSNERPTVQELLNKIHIKDFTIDFDAMHCQKIQLNGLTCSV